MAKSETVNSFDTSQSMKLESYLHISDPLLWPGVKATKGPCDQIDSPVKHKSQQHRQHLRSTWPGKANRTNTQRAAAWKSPKTSNLGSQLEASGEGFTINDVKVKQESQSQYSHSCARCRANIATLCDIWTTLCTLLMKCEVKQIYFPMPLHKDVLCLCMAC